MLPRSYQEQVVSPHTRGFKMTSNVGAEFPEPNENLQTVDGKERLQRTIQQHDTYVAGKKEEYDHFMANKRTIFASRFQSRWAPTTIHGNELNGLVCDPNYLFKKSLLPLDHEKDQIQTEAFRRTTRAGLQFKQEQASII